MRNCRLPNGIIPRKVNSYVKGQLREKGIKVPRNMEPVAREGIDNRRIPTHRLIARLGLAEFDGLHAHECLELTPETVYVPFRQHIGKPAVPAKAVGDHVVKGDVLGAAARRIIR